MSKLLTFLSITVQTTSQSAKGWDESQGDVGTKTNFSAGYGGKFGVQDVKDKVGAQ